MLPRLNVVLKSPVIPWNTGNAGRTCLGFGAALHLIKPLGFDPSHTQAKRAGLDYWPNVNLHIHESWEIFERDVLISQLNNNGYLFSKQDKHGEKPLHETEFFNQDNISNNEEKVALIFGSEQKGLDGISESSLSTLPRVYFPMNTSSIRSYNLSSSVAMGLSEAYRQTMIHSTINSTTQQHPHRHRRHFSSLSSNSTWRPPPAAQQHPHRHRRHFSSLSSNSTWRPPPAATHCNTASLPTILRNTYIPLLFDASADKMLNNNKQMNSFVPHTVRTFGAYLATTFGSTHNDASALFNTRHMFAVSEKAARALLFSPLASVDQKLPKLLDVGAASGDSTVQMKQWFDYVVATEASAICCKKLENVVDVAIVSTDLRQAKEYGKYNVISLLNVLDRTENPEKLLTDAKELLNDDQGVLLLGFSMPLRPFIQPQTFTKSKEDNDQHLSTFFANIASDASFEEFVISIHQNILEEHKLEIVRWSKFPYVSISSGKDNLSENYMDQVLFVVRPNTGKK